VTKYPDLLSPAPSLPPEFARPAWASGLPDLSSVALAMLRHFAAAQDSEAVLRLTDAILTQWPARSEDDPALLAYTRNTDCQERGIRTRIRVGAWINKIFPDTFGGRALDALIAAHGTEDYTLTMLDDIDDIVGHMVSARSNGRGCGFGSCMAAGFSERHHPYRVYDPSLGWRLALLARTADGQIVARTLVNSGHYVKVYAADSHLIQRMENHLDAAGIQEVSGWRGCCIRAIRRDGALVGPYLDGDAICGEVGGTGTTVRLDDEGPIWFNRTDGYADGEDAHASQVVTYDGDWIDEGDAVWMDYSYGGRRIQGHYHVDDVVYDAVADEYYRRDDATMLHDDTWCLTDDVIEVEGERYRYGDPAIVEEDVTGGVHPGG